LDSQDGSATRGDNRHHGQRVYTNGGHLLYGASPTPSPSSERQQAREGAWCRPELSRQAAKIRELIEYAAANSFENAHVVGASSTPKT
jgi:hypothetical protein